MSLMFLCDVVAAIIDPKNAIGHVLILFGWTMLAAKLAVLIILLSN